MRVIFLVLLTLCICGYNVLVPNTPLQMPNYESTHASFFDDLIGAWGRLAPENGLYAAVWELARGTVLEVVHGEVACTVTVQDRGPAHHLVRSGRKLDLSPRAFERLSPLNRGVIPVKWRVLKQEESICGH